MDLRTPTPNEVFYGQNIIYVKDRKDLPSGSVITLQDNYTYEILDVVDLGGDRIVCGVNTTIIGKSSENCRLKSTGLVGTALITSNYSLPLRNITIEADIALNLNGDGVTTALDWFGVNFTDCNSVGTISNYSNFIMQDSAFLNSGGLTFDGTIGTIGIDQSLVRVKDGSFGIRINPTCVITRRLRIIYSSFVALAGSIGVSVDGGATIPLESYILDTVNFSGGGDYIDGVDDSSDKALFINCVGITNTAVNGQMYMQNNATATTIAVQNTWYKVAGVTIPSVDNSKVNHSDNRLTIAATISRKYEIDVKSLSFTAGNGNVCEFGFFDSQLNDIRVPSRTKATANAAGRAENVGYGCVISGTAGKYIEVWCRNTSAATDITVESFNCILKEIK